MSSSAGRTRKTARDGLERRLSRTAREGQAHGVNVSRTPRTAREGRGRPDVCDRRARKGQKIEISPRGPARAPRTAREGHTAKTARKGHMTKTIRKGQGIRWTMSKLRNRPSRLAAIATAATTAAPAAVTRGPVRTRLASMSMASLIRPDTMEIGRSARIVGSIVPVDPARDDRRKTIRARKGRESSPRGPDTRRPTKDDTSP